MAKIKLDRNLCKKCGICSEFCPVDVYSFNELEGPKAEREDDCTTCGICVEMCPDFAIEVYEDEEVKQ